MQPGTIGASAPQRQWAQLSRSGDNVPVEQISPSSISYLQSLDLEIGYMKKGLEIQEVYSVDELQRHFIKLYNGIVFSAGQSLPFEYHGENIMGRVKGLSTLELADEQMRGGPPSSSSKNRGILMDKTDISFIKAADSAIKIKGSAKKLVAPSSKGLLFYLQQIRAPPNAILQANFKFEDMGIGGLDTEFSEIFRRAFASRVFPPGLVEKLGIDHVKGT